MIFNFLCNYSVILVCKPIMKSELIESNLESPPFPLPFYIPTLFLYKNYYKNYKK